MQVEIITITSPYLNSIRPLIPQVKGSLLERDIFINNFGYKLESWIYVLGPAIFSNHNE